MAVFIYKGMTDKGLIVKNKVEEENKQKLMEKLKQNNITPIDIVRVGFASANKSKKRKNISNAKDILKGMGYRFDGKMKVWYKNFVQEAEAKMQISVLSQHYDASQTEVRPSTAVTRFKLN